MRIRYILIWLGALCMFLEDFPVFGQENKKFLWSGVIRTRMQGDYQNNKRAENRFMHGFRLTGTLLLSDKIDVRARLKSGSASSIASSGWMTFGDMFANENITLGWVYVRLRLNPKLTLMTGKFPSPFFRPTQLVMDNDVSPEGFAQQFLIKENDSGSFQLNFGQFMINQVTSPVKDLDKTYFLGGQAVAHFKGPQRSQTFAIGYYSVTGADSLFAAQNLRASPLIKAANSNRANDNHTGYLSRFRIINLSAQLSQIINGHPWKLSADYVYNMGAKNMKQGITGLLTYGSMSKVGGNQGGIQIFFIEQDATIATFSNVDYTQTNSRGIGFLFGRHLINKMKMDIALYSRKYDSPKTLISPTNNNAWRTRFRIVFSFQLN